VDTGLDHPVEEVPAAVVLHPDRAAPRGVPVITDRLPTLSTPAPLSRGRRLVGRALARPSLPALVGLVAALLAFGIDSYAGVLRMAPLYTELMRQDKWPWNEFISAFAFLRYFGLPIALAVAVQALVALAAATVTWVAWARDWPEKVPVLAAATLLAPPYLLTYDSLLMVIPIGYWLSQERRIYLAAALWLLCFLPIAFYFNLYRGPNTVPLAAILTLAVFCWKRRRRAPAADVDHAHLV